MEQVLGGSWGLVSIIISTVPGDMTASRVTLFITLVKSHAPPSRPRTQSAEAWAFKAGGLRLQLGTFFLDPFPLTLNPALRLRELGSQLL